MMGTKKWSFYLFSLNLSIVFLLSCTPNWFTFNSVQSCKEWLYGSRSDHGTWKGRKQTLPLAQPSYIRDAGTEGGGALAPKFLADQLTLFQLRGEDSAHPLLLAPPNLFTFRQCCVRWCMYEGIKIKTYRQQKNVYVVIFIKICA